MRNTTSITCYTNCSATITILLSALLPTSQLTQQNTTRATAVELVQYWLVVLPTTSQANLLAHTRAYETQGNQSEV